VNNFIFLLENGIPLSLKIGIKNWSHRLKHQTMTKEKRHVT